MPSEDIELFLEDFPGVVPGPFPEPSLELKFGHRLPRTLLDFMAEYGFSGFAHGLFWLVDPHVWQPTVEMFLEVFELPQPVGELTAFGRTAFGDLYCWAPETGLVIFSPVTGHVYVRDFSDRLPGRPDQVIGSFFSVSRPDSFDLEDESGEPLFERAYASLGELSAGEVYGFFPPLRMGGPAVLENLQKVDALAHMVILTDM